MRVAATHPSNEQCSEGGSDTPCTVTDEAMNGAHPHPGVNKLRWPHPACYAEVKVAGVHPSQKSSFIELKGGCGRENKKLMRSKLLLENTTRARKVNKTKEHSASIDGYKHNIVLIIATNNENLLSQKFIETTEGQLLM